MILFLLSIFIFFIFGCVGVQNHELSQTIGQNLFSFLYFFHSWGSTPFYTMVVDLYGVILKFVFSPYTSWIFLVFLYIQFMTYFKTSRNLVTTAYLCISIVLSLFYSCLSFHENLAHVLFCFTLVVIFVFLLFFYLCEKRRKTNFQVYLKKIDESPHMPTRLANVAKAFTLIPSPVSSYDQLCKFFYYDFIFVFISLVGLIKSNLILSLLFSYYFLSKGNFYNMLSAIVWISLSLALLVFDSYWSKDFKLHNGETVLYLLGYNNIYTNMYNTVLKIGLYSFVLGGIGLTSPVDCSPETSETAKPTQKTTFDVETDTMTIESSVGACSQRVSGSVEHFNKLAAKANEGIKKIIELDCAKLPPATVPAGERAGRVLERAANEVFNKVLGK